MVLEDRKSSVCLGRFFGRFGSRVWVAFWVVFWVSVSVSFRVALKVRDGIGFRWVERAFVVQKRPFVLGKRDGRFCGKRDGCFSVKKRNNPWHYLRVVGGFCVRCLGPFLGLFLGLGLGRPKNAGCGVF